jgi:hypothetical protein
MVELRSSLHDFEAVSVAVEECDRSIAVLGFWCVDFAAIESSLDDDGCVVHVAFLECDDFSWPHAAPFAVISWKPRQHGARRECET